MDEGKYVFQLTYEECKMLVTISDELQGIVSTLDIVTEHYEGQEIASVLWGFKKHLERVLKDFNKVTGEIDI